MSYTGTLSLAEREESSTRSVGVGVGGGGGGGGGSAAFWNVLNTALYMQDSHWDSH